MSTLPPAQGAAGLIGGRYRIEHAIAEGGMGAVYAVHDERTGRMLALKRARGIERDQHLMTLFEREYRTLASVEHPRITRVYDYGLDGAAPYYTMDFVQGRDLHELAPVAFADACRYLRDVATSLALLHARRLLHRDITPRNVRVTAEGRCTLIDFGTLTSFGIPERAIGTPPFMPPEALRGAPLDQRADLFSFGALAYWTLTRKHAYHARTVAELPEVWQRAVVPPSKLVANIPEQANTLILSLLSLDPNARPSSIAEVVDRLSALCKLPPEDERSERALAESYLAHTQLVGRDLELNALRERIVRLKQGQGSAVTVDGPSGSGRTRLLRELTLHAQLLSVPAIAVDGAATSSAYGCAVALLQRLLDASPAAQHAAQAHARVLAQLDRGLAARLAQQATAPEGNVSGAWRARVQEALQQVVAAACTSGPLLIAVDNADEADEPSLALLAALCSLTSHNLVLVMSVASVPDRAHGRSLSRRVLKERSETVELAPLSLEHTLRLTSSVFGDAKGCARIADWLHQRSAGLPLHCMALIRKLYALGTARYEGGMWLLASELPDAAMADGLRDLLADRLQELTPAARGLAEALAIQRGALTRAVCVELAKAEAAAQVDPLTLLDELLRADVLTDTIDGYRFSHGVMRRLSIERMSKGRARSLHTRCAEQALSAAGRGEEVSARITAGWHMLHAGEESRGADLLADVTYDTFGIRFALADLQVAAPALEAALEVYSRQQRSIYERLPLLTGLANAGYYEERKWAERYGEEALAAVIDVAELELARKLQKVIGKTLGLAAALFVAFVRFKIKAGRSVRYRFKDLLVQLMGVVTALTGVATLALDVERAIRVAATLDPFMHLPERLTPVGIGQVCRALREIGREQQATALRTWAMLVERFSDPRYYSTLPAHARPLYIGALWFPRGIFETFRDGPGALETADKLERSGLKLYRMIASEVRMLYHLNRGEVAEAERHRAEVDLHAIQIGSASQIELFEPAALLLPYTAMGDATAIRQIADRLTKLAATTPSLKRYAELAVLARDVARVDLLTLGTRTPGSMSEYIPVICAARDAFLSEEPRAAMGWAANLGFCARALNLAGMHGDALRCAERVSAHMNEEDRSFVAMFLTAETELAVARAGLGDAVGAHEQLNELLTFHGGSDNPLTRGRIHEACARVAVLLKDRAAFNHHLAETRNWFRAAGAPVLAARAETLAAYARLSSKPPRVSQSPATASTRPADGPTSIASMENIVTAPHRQRRMTPSPTQPTVTPRNDDMATVVQPDDGSPKH